MLLGPVLDKLEVDELVFPVPATHSKRRSRRLFPTLQTWNFLTDLMLRTTTLTAVIVEECPIVAGVISREFS
jgi:hypothetical protein